MKRFLSCLVTLIAFIQIGKTQTRYIVKFRDKATNPYSISSPQAYLSQRAIDRRARYSIAIDSTDLPLTPRYVDSVRLAGTVIILNKSKWLNSVSIQTSDAAAITKISSFPFVQSVTNIALRTINNGPAANKFQTESERELDITSDFFNYGSSFNQVHMHNGEFLHNIGLRGQGMTIGMLDAGYFNYLSLKAFDSVRANNQISGVYDFVVKDSSVNEDNSHGMECFSIIAANIPGQFVGTAPKSNFYLFRTEDASSEYPIEEHNWVCGAERVDSAGGDVISSSLGYGDKMSNPAFNHTYADMNGNTTMAAIGADLAAKKGILVVVAAGNEGSGSWQYILTPADADSVLSVGAVDVNKNVAPFSSYGPSSDGQVKPDVASMGVATIIQLPGNTIGSGNGTSFACPNMAGLTTCLWQGFPEFNNMKIINSLRQAASNVSSPNNRIGYGIPDMKKAVLVLLKEFATSSVSISNCSASLNWTSKDIAGMKYIIERLGPNQTSYVKVGEKAAAGTVFSTRSYQFLDDLQNLPVGNISYRISQVIDTSLAGFSADYIDTTAASLNFTCAGSEGIVAIPNPVIKTLTLKVSTSQNIPDLTIRVFNNAGQLISTVKKNHQQGVFFYDIPLPLYLPAGKYYVKTYNGSDSFATTEFIKL